ncbi:T9SS type A sorting domain-containing protein [Aureisphaera galaxeae]|uniref:T9SS type A sorting domain-containing protein n=1 Tax=Aureisphaera galaxeae TaxID=1538023 RepID=UPI002350CACE|nr:T9SS type A sorting domain-containing protein [Aureisphaera galaxeae]MDC8003327.1 T9SS type A sorting domain-containing protein [Aureisphaera galaxeae]
MKRFLLFSAFCLLGCVFINAQSISEDLLTRYTNLETNGKSPSHYFTQEEQSMLREYLQTNASQDTQEGGGALIYGPRNNAAEFGSFDPTDLTVFNTIGPSLVTADFESSGDIDPSNLTMGYVLTLSTGEFNSIDITTGTYTSMGTISPPPGQDWNGLEFDPATRTLYGISSDFSGTSSLSTIDVGSMSYTLVGDTGMQGAISIAITSSGDMYSYDVVDDNFYSIDTSTGAATLLGPIGFDANFGQDLEWDDSSGTMYMVCYNAGIFEGEVRTVDLGNGFTTLLGNLIPSESGTQMAWAAIQNPEILSVSENAQNSFSIAPNPAQGQLEVSSRSNIEQIAFVNLLGQTVLQFQNPSSSTFNISELHSGVYFVVVTTELGTSNVKLVVE